MKSLYMIEIISSLKNEPHLWEDVEGCGLENKSLGVGIEKFINDIVLPRNILFIGDKVMQTSHRERRALERAVRKWYGRRTIKELK